MTERGVGKNEAPGTLRESTGSQEEGSQSVGWNQPKAKKQPLLNWIPSPEEEFPMHLAVGTKAHAFILWAENYKLNPECYEVWALQFIPNHIKVTGKIVARVMWALVYGMMGERHPVPD